MTRTRWAQAALFTLFALALSWGPSWYEAHGGNAPLLLAPAAPAGADLPPAP
ncbi:MAG: hypothetical protein QM767_27695 [Anaeromyxobacter sp.]